MTSAPPSDRLSAILQGLQRVWRSAKGYMALCPAHADRSPSLSLADGEDGRVLLYCFAGCSLESICAAIGIDRSDIASDTHNTAFSLETTVEHMVASVARMERGAWACVAQYVYADRAGAEVFRILRIESLEDKPKTFRAIRFDGSCWLPEAPSGSVPPYRLPEALSATRIYVGEGEKVVEAARGLGLTASTNAFGANGVRRTDWSSFAGKDVVLLPDNDGPGAKWKDSLTQALFALEPRPRVHVVHLPGIPEGGDLVEFIAAARAEGKADEHIRADIEKLIVASTGSDRTGGKPPPPPKRAPFPIEFLPAPVRELVQAIADSRSISLDVPAAISLAALACAIGLSRVAYDDYVDWQEVSVIWLAVVVRSGTRKTVVLSDLFEPHFERQARQSAKFEKEKGEHANEWLEWKVQVRRAKSTEVPPEPAAPKLAHTYTTDATPEAIISILQSTPRGVLVLEDELSHFFGGLGLYSGKADRDRAFYLSLFRGMQYKGDRKSSGSVVIPMAAASIVGGIQPKILKNCFDDAALYSGLASRFLLVDAPPQVKQYLQGPTAAMRAAYARLIDRLFELQMDGFVGEFGLRSAPQRVYFDESARELLRDFVPRWSEESLLHRADVEAAMSKLEGYAIRFALILRVCREIEGKAEASDPITRKDLEGGIRIARWFLDRALQVYGDLRSSGDRALDSELHARVEVIRHRFGGAVTRREWHKINTRRSADEAAKELDELVEAGLAAWRDRPAGPGGGRPTEECALVEPADPDRADEEVSGCGLRGAPQEPEEPGGADQNGNPEGVSGCSQRSEADSPPSHGSGNGVSDGSDHCNPQPATRNHPPDTTDGDPSMEEGFRVARPALDSPEERETWEW